MNGKASESEHITLQLKRSEVKLILKSLKRCLPDHDDQEEVVNVVGYLQSLVRS